MSALHDAYPDVPFYFTERSTWGTKGMDEILRYFRHWARSYSAWVTCLDDRQQPNPGPHSCSPTFVTVSRDDPNEIRYIPETHLLGQISRFVQRGARRIESDYGSTRTLTGAAFANPDGSHVVIMVNGTRREQRLTLVYPGLRADTTIPARTVATCVW
jgi:O-glycosyl hydrolase